MVVMCEMILACEIIVLMGSGHLFWTISMSVVNMSTVYIVMLQMVDWCYTPYVLSCSRDLLEC